MCMYVWVYICVKKCILFVIDFLGSLVKNNFVKVELYFFVNDILLVYKDVLIYLRVKSKFLKVYELFVL